MKTTPALQLLLFLYSTVLTADITISIDAEKGRLPISPWIYGRNNSISDNPSKPTPSADWQRYREAGLRLLRENGGNNASKYNWRQKLSSHPDWYNNVYAHDWDYQARTLQDSLPENVLGFQALQLIGWAAANNNHNFNDWDYNSSAGWTGCTQNLAGGGTVNSDGGDSALTEGDPSRYLEPWPADSATGILDHWFGEEGLGLDKNRFRYWNMDNEPEIWAGTHDDIMPEGISAEEFMQKYFAVAKSARARFPEIKLVGFVACNEWQWYAWNNSHVTINENGTEKNYVWAEYFIKRIAEEQKATGIRLLDVMDFHFYPQIKKQVSLATQLHRVWFDTTWNYPNANGCKMLGGGWDKNSTKEFIMERCSRWLNHYMGAGHGVQFGVSECGTPATGNTNVTAVWYASQLGTFADHGVELFTPWSWSIGMWEVLHLFSRYAGSIRIASESSVDTVVSAYSSLSSNGSSMTVLLVNRDSATTKNVTISTSGFVTSETTCSTYTLSSLPADVETFQSHSDNALAKATVPVNDGTVTLPLSAMSVTAVRIAGSADMAVHQPSVIKSINRFSARLTGSRLRLNFPGRQNDVTVILYRPDGTRVVTRKFTEAENISLSLRSLSPGTYIVDAGSNLPRTRVLTVH